MTQEERQAWLDGLKVGDEVAIGHWYWADGSFTARDVRRITNITPSRRICCGDQTFTSGGSGRGSCRWLWLGPVSDEIRAAARKYQEAETRKEALFRLYRTNWDALTTETLQKVIGVLDGAEKPAGAGA